MNYTVYTDGACSNNPGPGGYAFVILVNNEEQLKLSAPKKQTTNNEMELAAIVSAMEHLKLFDEPANKSNNAVFYSDSAYCLNAINQGWLFNWAKNGWKTNKGQDVKNKELWERFYNVASEMHMSVKFVKVKGHAGNYYNEMVDKMAKAAIERGV